MLNCGTAHASGGGVAMYSSSEVYEEASDGGILSKVVMCCHWFDGGGDVVVVSGSEIARAFMCDGSLLLVLVRGSHSIPFRLHRKQGT